MVHPLFGFNSRPITESRRVRRGSLDNLKGHNSIRAKRREILASRVVSHQGRINHQERRPRVGPILFRAVLDDRKATTDKSLGIKSTGEHGSLRRSYSVGDGHSLVAFIMPRLRAKAVDVRHNEVILGVLFPRAPANPWPKHDLHRPIRFVSAKTPPQKKLQPLFALIVIRIVN